MRTNATQDPEDAAKSVMDPSPTTSRTKVKPFAQRGEQPVRIKYFNVRHIPERSTSLVIWWCFDIFRVENLIFREQPSMRHGQHVVYPQDAVTWINSSK